MFCHSAMFTLVDGASVSPDELVELLVGLKDSVPVCNAVSVATNTVQGDGAATVLFISEFDSWEDYQEYRRHPGHQAVLDRLHGQLQPSVFVDFTEPLERHRKASGAQ